METSIDITEARVYVGTYHKYNEGSIEGKWLDISDFDTREEFYNACRELHSDEEDPEFMFQDYENIPESLIDESWLSSNLFEVMQALSDMDDEKREPFLIWCDNFHQDLSKQDVDDLIDSFENDYMGEYETEEDFARELVSLRNDLSEFALQHFDYESYARDLFIDGYWFNKGHVFRDS